MAGPVGGAPGPLPGSTQQDAPEITDPSGQIFLLTEGDTLAAPAGQAGGLGGWYFNPAGSVIIYQWLRCDAVSGCVPIPGATNPTYTLTAADDADTIEVQVSAEDNFGQGPPLTSGATNPIIPLPAMATGPPTLNGQAYVGSTLVGGVGSWASPATYWTRQWMQCEPGLKRLLADRRSDER